MARKKKKASTGPFNPGAIGAVARGVLGEGMDAVWRVGTVLFVLALAIAWFVGRDDLMRASGARGGAMVLAVEFVTPPNESAENLYVPGFVVTKMQERVTTTVTSDPFNRSKLTEAAGHLRASGWFTAIDNVRRSSEGVVRVEGAWREPRAVVQRGGSSVLVGRDSAPMDRFGIDLSPLVKIVNPLESAPWDAARGTVAYGVEWGLSDVDDAIRLLDLMAGAGLESSVLSIDVDDPERIVITSTRGARILWGAPPERDDEIPVPGETNATRKLEMLEVVLLDARYNQPGQVRDIRTGELAIDRTPRS